MRSLVLSCVVLGLCHPALAQTPFPPPLPAEVEALQSLPHAGRPGVAGPLVGDFDPRHPRRREVPRFFAPPFSDSAGNVELLHPPRLLVPPRPVETAAAAGPLPGLTTFVHRIRHIPARSAAEAVDRELRERHLFQPAGTGLVLEAPVVLVPDPQTNSLVVTAAPQFVDEVRRLIDEADREPKQYEMRVLISQIGPDGKTDVLSRPIIRTVEGQATRIKIGRPDGSHIVVDINAIGEVPSEGVRQVSAVEPKPPAVKYCSPCTVSAKAEPCDEVCQYRERQHRWIERELDKRVSLHFENTPLNAAFKQIAATAGINVVLDGPGLEEEGVTADRPVSLEVEQVTLRGALHLLLDPLHLGFVVQDEVLKITSRLRTQGKMTVRTYPVAKLLGPQPANDLPVLIEQIAATVTPDEWQEQGGGATIQPFAALESLVVRHTHKGHEELADLLADLRHERTKDAGEKQVLLAPTTLPPLPTVRQPDRRIFCESQAPKQVLGLHRPISLKIENQPLREAVREIARAADVNVVIDEAELMQEGWTPDMRVSLDATDLRLRSALNLLLEPLHLGFVAEHGVLTITSRQRAHESQLTRYYDVDDLLIAAGTDRFTAMTGLIGQITETVRPGEWKERGNDQTIRPLSPPFPCQWGDLSGLPAGIDTCQMGRYMVVRHNRRMHEEIADLLEQLRHRRKLQPE